MRLNDHQRWEQVAQRPSKWDERNALIASYIPAGASVLDLGAGARTIRDYMPGERPTYQAVDLIESPDVIRCDFNAGELPRLTQRYDMAICSGLLEYIIDVEGFLARLPTLARTVIFSYAPRVTGDTRAKRSAWGWVNHFSRLDIVAMLEELDRPWTFLREWRSQLLVWVALEPGPRPVVRGRPRPSDVEWDCGIEELERRAAEGPDAQSPASHQLDVDAWVAAQRRARRDKTLERGRVRRLERIPGWSWLDDEAGWREQFARLAAVPSDAVPSSELRTWAAEQRAERLQGRLRMERAVALSTLPGWVWDADEAAWADGLRVLRRFAKIRHHSVVPVSYTTRHNDFELGAWVVAQRRAFTQGTLPEQRAAELRKLPAWAWAQGEAEWERGLLALRRFIEREGHAVITPGTMEGPLDLGAWLAQQREAHGANTLDDARGRRLGGLGALEPAPQTLAWYAGLAALRRYADSNGHANPLPDEQGSGPPVGAWLAAQRTKRTWLSSSQIAALEALPGFVWDERDAPWERAYAALRSYAQAAGHSSPTTNARIGVIAIGQWVRRQRTARAAGQLADERAQRLETLLGWAWTGEQGRFERGFAQLLRHVEEHGFASLGAPPPAVRTFVAGQRRRRARHELDAVDALRLEGVTGWTWEPLPATVARALVALRDFASREGRVDVPRDHVERGVRLGHWLEQQAEAHIAGDLNPDVSRLLRVYVPWMQSGGDSAWATTYRGLVKRARVAARQEPPKQGQNA